AHDRMPAIISDKDAGEWLSPETGEDRLMALLVPYPPEEMTMHEVSKRVNLVKNDDPGVIEKAGSAPA
ncbi:MAG: SOS response-associated peptidase family protein, partial [Spirochaetota bacterium]